MEDGERRPWSPDAELTIEGAERLLAEQFPEVLRGVSKRVSEISSEPMSGATRPDLLPSGIPRPRIERLGSGWDNVAYLVGGRWVFRFPKREMGALCMRNEIASLPRIADALPLKVPRITHVGSPERARSVGSADAAYPYPFAGYELMGRVRATVVAGNVVYEA